MCDFHSNDASSSFSDTLMQEKIKKALIRLSKWALVLRYYSAGVVSFSFKLRGVHSMMFTIR